MKKTVYFWFPVLFLIFFLPCGLWAQTASIEVIHSSDSYHPGQTCPVIFKIHIKDGWYIHGTGDVHEGIIATSMGFSDTPDLKVRHIRFPAAPKKKVGYLDEPVNLFSGEILADVEVVFSENDSLAPRILQGTLSYQACSDTMCIQPEKVPVTATFAMTPPGTATRDLNPELFASLQTRGDDYSREMETFQTGRGVALTLALIFLGGLALNLSPCIYPMIPISVSYFGGKSGTMKGKTLLHGLLYLFGLSLTNSALGVFSALSGNMMGAALQHPAALVVIALILAGLAFSFFDFWELRMPSALNAVASKNFSGYFGTFFMGLTLGIIAAPCIGPFVLGLFTYVGQKGDPLFGFLCFFILSIGMGLPICILAMFTGALKKLPLSGDWMLWIRKIMGWVLMAMAAYMIRPLLSGDFLKSGLFLVVGLAAGLHLGFIDKAGEKNTSFVRLKRLSGVVVILLGMIYFSTAYSPGPGIGWQPYDETLIEKAAQEGTPVIIDFSADWCLPCKRLEKIVFSDPEIVSLSEKFLAIRLDLTTRQVFQDEILKKYQVIGVPTVIFLNRRGEEETDLRMASEASKSEFLAAMNRLIE